MERASRVMYTIANVFTWIEVFFTIVGIVLTILNMTHVINVDGLGLSMLITFIFVLIINLILISMVRIAKSKKSSKGWDILFIVLGVLGWNVFYILGGIFGLVARR